MKYRLFLIISFLYWLPINAQDNTMLLWPEVMPNHQPSNEVEIQTQKRILKIQNVQRPDIKIFLPENDDPPKKAVIICPGGGYGMLAYDWEGTDIAKWFNTIGIAAFVLK